MTPIRPQQAARLALPVLLVGLAACVPTQRSAVQSLPPGADARTTALAQMKDGLDKTGGTVAMRAAAPVTVVEAPLITGMGFAQVSGQPGKSINEKRLMAIRAARVDALRDLTEQVHGIRVTSETAIRDAIVLDDRLNAVVQGSIRGARTVRITQKTDDAVEVVMALDKDTVGYILRAARGGF